MSTQDFGQYSAAVKQNGVLLNANEPLVALGTVTLPSGTTVGGVAVANNPVTATSTTAFTVGPNGTTNPTFNVNTNTASAATGLRVTGAAAAGGIALAATSSGTDEFLSVDGKGAGVIYLGRTSTGIINIGRSSAKPFVSQKTTVALGTAQNTTPTAAQVRGGIITQVSATGAGTCTLDTGTNISAALGTTPVAGDSFESIYANLSGGQTVTITGATGSTVIGAAAVASGAVARLTFVNTGTNTWNVYVTVGA